MKIICIIIIFFIAGCTANEKNVLAENTVATPPVDGGVLFKVYCASCHKVDKDFTGPALKGALERWGDKNAMYDYIRNPAKSIVENAYAKKLFEKWNKSLMPAFPNLSEAELDAIMNYCEAPVQ